MIIIRKAVANDAADLTELLRLLTDDPNVSVLPEWLEELGGRADSFVLVAEFNGRPVGTVQVAFCPDVMYRRQPYAVVENLYVRADARGLGIGKAMMNKVEELCLAQDCSKIMLLSSARRENAHLFFKSLGFDGNLKKGFVKYRKAFSKS